MLPSCRLARRHFFILIFPLLRGNRPLRGFATHVEANTPSGARAESQGSCEQPERKEPDMAKENEGKKEKKQKKGKKQERKGR